MVYPCGGKEDLTTAQTQTSKKKRGDPQYYPSETGCSGKPLKPVAGFVSLCSTITRDWDATKEI